MNGANQEDAMSETAWQELSTAPIDTVVRLGKWDLFSGKLEWRETLGAPWERGWFGRRKPSYYAREYTHWLPAPPPPGVGEEHGEG